MSCDEPYVRCVAVAGGSPGLGFSASGAVLWREVNNTVAELWVSLDARLILYRTREDSEVLLSRATRQLELPLGKPVVVLHGDEFAVNGHRYRLHVHGLAAEVRPPEPLRFKRSRAAVVGAAVALGAMGPGCDGSDRNPIEVRSAPPIVAVPVSPLDAGRSGPDAGTSTHVDSGTADTGSMKRQRSTIRQPGPPIEIRKHPPAPVARPPVAKKPGEPTKR